MGARILLVDDDPDVRLAIGTILEAEAYQVRTARDGVEALEKIREEVPDLLILDLLMPRKDGFTVIRELRENPKYKDLPILILTAVREDASRRRYELETGLQMDVQDYVEKRTPPAELLRRVGKLIKKGRGGAEAANSAPASPGKTKILLVDDDPDFVMATSLVLREAGYEVITTLQGQEALPKAREVKPDLIILDVIMPDRDGFLVCEDLKSDAKLASIPVMMLTSFAERVAETTTSVAQGMRIEAEDYVDKPVRPQELLRRVEKLLKRLKR